MPSQSKPRSLFLLAACLTLLSGCRGHDVTLAVPPGSYAPVFEASTEALRDSGFTLERVDAARGVITTRPKFTAGLFTPAHPEQQTAGQEWQDAINEQSRVVRLTFEPQGRRPASGDLRDAEGPLMLRAQTTIYRTRVTGVRYETETTGVRSVSRDPIAIRKGHGGLQRVPLRRDEPWSQRLITLIANRIEQPAANAGPDA